MKLEKEVKIGAITLLALIMGYVCLSFLKGVDVFTKKKHYYVCFHNIGDVSTATPVKINGFKVGSVQAKELYFDEEQQIYVSQLDLSITPEVRLMKGSKIEIRSNMLTGTELVVNMPKSKSKTFYADGDTIPAKEDGLDFLAVAENELMPEMQKVLPKMTQTLDNLNKMLTSGAIDSTLQSLKRSSTLMEESLIKLTASIKPMPELMTNLSKTSKSLSVVGKEVEKVKLEELVANLTETSARLKEISQDINSSKGSLGLLIKDKSLYRHIDSLANSADSLLTDIRKHPKRYVKLSLF